MFARIFRWGLFACALQWATPAFADDQGHWLRAESTHFIVYGHLEERTLRSVVHRLELFDAELRALGSAPAEEANKFEIYLVGGISELRTVIPSTSQEILGFYNTAIDLTASFAIYGGQHGLASQDVLFHEYTHHFMFHNTRGDYPPWFVEGYAEFMQTMTFENDQVVIGEFDPGRVNDIIHFENWPSIEQFLSQSPDFSDPRRASSYYGESWLAVHYIQYTPGRLAQFHAYLQALENGGDPITAFQPAFGMTPAQFETELHRYATQRLMHSNGPAPRVDDADVQITRLPPSADDLLLPVARMRLGAVSDADAPAFAAQIERLASHYPDDTFAQYARARAAMANKNLSGARAILQPMLAAQADDVEANMLMGKTYIQEASAAPAGGNANAIAAQGRRYFAQAFRGDPNNVPTLYYYAESYMFGGEPMTDDAVNVLVRAYNLAPQVPAISINTASVLMHRRRFREAVGILRPIAYSPHGGSKAAVELLNAALHGQEPGDGPISDDEDSAEPKPPAPPPAH